MEENKYFLKKVASSWTEGKRLLNSLGPGWIFRGQRDFRWNLVSSIERLRLAVGLDIVEKILLKEFRRKAHQFINYNQLPIKSLIEWLALMQHYGTPTRLLDWTRSPYVATYFAVEDAEVENESSAVWALDIEWCKQSAINVFKSANVYSDEINLNMDFGSNEIFREFILENKVKMVIPISPHISNERLGIQQGLFLAAGDITSSFINNLKATCENNIERKLIKIILPNKFRMDALSDLDRMNINRQTLFPGIDGFAQSLKYKLSILTSSDQIKNQIERGLAEAFLYI
jgi:hypothetical protein